jgi:signal recognition particle subunit SRP72
VFSTISQVLILTFVELCDASQDLSEEEKKSELVPIQIQQTYIATILGKLEDAAKISKEIDLKE